MAISTTDFNETEGLPGLLFGFVPHSIESGILQDSKEAIGGFPLYTKEGEAGKVYATKPEGGAFVGLACFTSFNGNAEGYTVGDAVNVLKKGRLWVRVSGEVKAGQGAKIDGNGNITAGEGTEIGGGVFKSNASDKGLAQLEIA